uniref:Uncharacterized protein n=1 Tax=Arundo donax TaxID=35708 RepID=A0A0A9F5J5_ARUDO
MEMCRHECLLYSLTRQ